MEYGSDLIKYQGKLEFGNIRTTLILFVHGNRDVLANFMEAECLAECYLEMHCDWYRKVKT